MMNEVHANEQKKPYSSPELTDFGSVSELTQRLGSGFTDGGPKN